MWSVILVNYALAPLPRCSSFDAVTAGFGSGGIG
jgi:hypothetical protein